MKVYSSNKMKAIDEFTINQLGIPGIILMENAGLAVVECMKEYFSSFSGKKIAILCGSGNNGGDGLVIARHLKNKGADLSVFLLAAEDTYKGDAATNLKMARAAGVDFIPIVDLYDYSQLIETLKPALTSEAIVDAIFGTGIKKEIREPIKSIINAVNQSQKIVFSVDIPSGVDGDTGNIWGTAIKATVTVTFGYPKIGLYLYPGAEYVGRLIVADISIPKKVEDVITHDFELITSKLASSLLPQRSGDAHKGDCGKIFILAGSSGMSGAAMLTAMGALRSGAGLVYLAIPQGINNIIETRLIEVITIPLPQTESGTISRKALPRIKELMNSVDIIVIGPGLGREKETQDVVGELFTSSPIPMIIDADGLFALREDLLSLSRSGSLIITPHYGEMARLINKDPHWIKKNKLDLARIKSKEWNLVLVLKGAPTIVASPDKIVRINSTGNPGMATGGSGDILTGIIASFWGQGLTASDASALGVYIHGLAGDICAKQKGILSIIPTDIAEKIPAAITECSLGRN